MLLMMTGLGLELTWNSSIRRQRCSCYFSLDVPTYLPAAEWQLRIFPLPPNVTFVCYANYAAAADLDLCFTIKVKATSCDEAHGNRTERWLSPCVLLITRTQPSANADVAPADASVLSFALSWFGQKTVLNEIRTSFRVWELEADVLSVERNCSFSWKLAWVWFCRFLLLSTCCHQLMWM